MIQWFCQNIFQVKIKQRGCTVKSISSILSKNRKMDSLPKKIVICYSKSLSSYLKGVNLKVSDVEFVLLLYQPSKRLYS